MKKLFILALCLLTASPSFAASQWDKANPAGTTNIADLDSYITTINNEAQDRLNARFRRGVVVDDSSSTAISVGAGEIAVPDATDAVIKWRRVASATSVGWSDIDTGVEANSTQYYVYITADTDVTGGVFKISTSASAPSGSTYYRKIGYFYNDSSGNIVNVGNVKDSDAPNAMTVLGTTDISTTSGTYSDMTDMSVQFMSSGRPVRVLFEAPIYEAATGTTYIKLVIDGTDKLVTLSSNKRVDSTAYPKSVPLMYLDTTLSSGVHTIKIQWKTNISSYQYGATDGNRVLIVEEL
jgi:hypothetical protein